MAVLVTSAALPDRAIVRDLLFRLRLAHAQITLVWADSAYSGELVGWAGHCLGLTLQIVSRPHSQVGFVVLPRRWVVERTLSWMMRARRNCRDHERRAAHSEAMITWASITPMSRRPAWIRSPGRRDGDRRPG